MRCSCEEDSGAGLGAGLMAGLRPGVGVGAGLEPSGTTSGPMGLRMRGALRLPWFSGPDCFSRGRPGPRRGVRDGWNGATVVSLGTGGLSGLKNWNYVLQQFVRFFF